MLLQKQLPPKVQASQTGPHLVLKSKDMPLLRRVMKASVFILLVMLLGAAPLRLCVTVRLRVIRSACSRPCSRQVVGSSQHCCTERRSTGCPASVAMHSLCCSGKDPHHAATSARGRAFGAFEQH